MEIYNTTFSFAWISDCNVSILINFFLIEIDRLKTEKQKFLGKKK